MYGKVIVDISSSAIDKVFDYRLDKPIAVGSRVFVPFGSRIIEGYLIETTENASYDESKIKSVISAIEPFPVINSDQLKLCEFLKKEYKIGMCDSLRLFLPSEMRSGKVHELVEVFLRLVSEDKAKEYMSNLRANANKTRGAILELLEYGERGQVYMNKKYGGSAINKLKTEGIILTRDEVKFRKPYTCVTLDSKKVTLTKTQQGVVNSVLASSGTYLLHGVTGSGKTEVYMHIIEQVTKNGKTAIMLVPEISLTPQVLASFRARFGEKVALIHSGLSSGERFDEWKRILTGSAKIVIGARSAIFAPLKDIGIIIIDEEHDGSYKSESHPRYNTIDVARERARLFGCSLVLGSATPSLDSYYNAICGNYKLIEMKERINKRELPPIRIIDMTNEVKRGNRGMFSDALLTSLEKTIKEGNQAMLFLNRRGYTSFLMCRDCGWVAKCQDCDVSLVYHKKENVLKCHYCGNRYKAFDVCPQCGSHDIKQGSSGTEKVVEELLEHFPNLKVGRMDNDTTKNKGSHVKILSDFKEGKTQVLVGTQMIAKGHDFPSVTLVGIIDADISLYQSSYSATERTFQLITQVAGRAGRADKTGEIILQTYVPRHYIYKMAAVYDYAGFYKKEANLRETTSYPPFAKIVRLLFTSSDEELVKNTCKVYYDSVRDMARDYEKDFIYLGVMKSPVGKIEGKYRYQILMRLGLERSREIIDKLYKLAEENNVKGVTCFVEINPQALN